ncbi:MAG: ankyrin repeat domain-containing protein [Bacteroidia bacterium]|nr:ankyrin repeat domain-containing protein [Bacteroidia bacterium]
MISKKLLLLSSIFIFFITIQSSVFAQGAKKAAAPAGKGTAKGTLAADMDCSVKINGSTVVIAVKAYTPKEVTLKVGENKIEAVSSDKKSKYNRSVTVKAGENTIIEISFFEDGKFLDYVKTGNVNMVEAAIKKDPSLINNENGLLTSSPLQIAIENSQPDLVKYFLDKGASFTSPENIFPLHKSILYASSAKRAKDKPAPDKELAELFLSKGCKITDKDDGGNTPLHCAARAGKYDILVMLIEKGADVNAKNDFDDTPLKIAQDKGFITIINYLKSKGAQEK